MVGHDCFCFAAEAQDMEEAGTGTIDMTDTGEAPVLMVDAAAVRHPTGAEALALIGGGASAPTSTAVSKLHLFLGAFAQGVNSIWCARTASMRWPSCKFHRQASWVVRQRLF